MTIAEVSRRMELSQDTLRYYEKQGLIPPVQRSPGGVRNYTEHDCRWILFIKCMRSAGVSVETLREYMRMVREGNTTISARKQLLLNEREKIAGRIQELNEILTRLDWKLDGYEERMLNYETSLLEETENSFSSDPGEKEKE